MHLKDTIQNLVLFIVKVYIFYLISKSIGIIKGIGLTFIILEIFNLILSKVFGLELITNQDSNFVAWDPEKQYNLPFVFVFEGKDKEIIKKVFIEKAIKFYKRLRQKMIFTLGNYYWNECSFEDAVKQIEFTDDILNDEDQIMRHCEQLVQKNPFKKEEFQWRLYLSENDNNQTIMVLQFDHSMFDGFGLLCLISKLTDNFDFKDFPRMKERTFFERLKTKLKIFFFIPFAIYLLHPSQTNKSPFKIYKPFTMNKKGVMSKKFEFSDLYKICKTLGITFNDYIISIILAASKKYSRDNGYEKLNEMSCFVPVNLRSQPKIEADMTLSNESSGCVVSLNYIDNPMTESHKIKNKADFLVRDPLFTQTVRFLNNSINGIMPFFVSRAITKGSAKHFDFVISNVPGPVKHIYVGGLKIVEMLGFPNPGPHSCFIGVFTYLNKLRLTLIKQENVECDEKEFMKYIEKEIEITLNTTKIE